MEKLSFLLFIFHVSVTCISVYVDVTVESVIHQGHNFTLSFSVYNMRFHMLSGHLYSFKQIFREIVFLYRNLFLGMRDVELDIIMYIQENALMISWKWVFCTCVNTNGQLTYSPTYSPAQLTYVNRPFVLSHAQKNSFLTLSWIDSLGLLFVNDIEKNLHI